MNILSLAAAGVAAAALVSGAAQADTPAKAPARQCFFLHDWQGWHAPNDKTLYLRVNLHDIYRLDLASGSSLLTYPDSHLVNVERGGSGTVCDPIDLDLSVSDGSGFNEHLFVSAVSKLTPEQVAAIPKKDLP